MTERFNARQLNESSMHRNHKLNSSHRLLCDRYFKHFSLRAVALKNAQFE